MTKIPLFTNIFTKFFLFFLNSKYFKYPQNPKGLRISYKTNSQCLTSQSWTLNFFENCSIFFCFSCTYRFIENIILSLKLSFGHICNTIHLWVIQKTLKWCQPDHDSPFSHLWCFWCVLGIRVHEGFSIFQATYIKLLYGTIIL